MSQKLLFEIGTEEIPAKYMPKALKQLEENAAKMLQEKRLSFKGIRTIGTPRRLTLTIEELSEKQENLEELVKGPSKKAAYDEAGAPSKALQGFLRGQKVDEKALEVRDLNGVEYIYAKRFEEGGDTFEALKTILPELMTSITFTKSMKWGNKTFRFARPIRWVLPLFGDRLVDFDKDGIACGRVTRGHRVLSQGEITINHPDEYISKLEKAFVIVDQDLRRKIIVEQCEALATKVNGELHMDLGLLEEVVHLVEYPTALMGEFEDEYLSLPKEAVITPMKEHQRYFPVMDKHGKLMNRFITVRNGNAEHLDIVKEGNEKVLRARLADAKFFYNEDKKVSLDACAEKLKTVVFIEALGTVHDKAERIKKLAAYLAEALNLEKAERVNLDRAAHLCKADLVTGMVNEFAELQGIMGMEYALLQGEKAEVADAIVEHYLPRFAGDIIPESTLGAILSISDKIDTITGCFAIGIQPTGSQDPYALRRQAIGIISIIMGCELNLGLGHLVEIALKNFTEKNIVKGDVKQVKKDIVEFIRLRYKNVMIDKGYEYDVIDAVINSSFDNIHDSNLKIETLKEWKYRTEFKDIVASFNRVNNLAAKAENADYNTELFTTEPEKNLVNSFVGIETDYEEAIENGEYEKAMEAIVTLKKPIDDFFDGVMVMAEDMDVRNSRLGLLRAISEMMLELGDVSVIV